MIKTLFLISILGFIKLFAGAVVSDPTAHSYSVEKIKIMNDQTANALKHLEEFNKLNEATQKANDFLENTGEKIFNPIKKLEDFQKNMENSQAQFQNLIKKAESIDSEIFFKYHHDVDEPLDEDAIKKYNKDYYSLFDDGSDEKLKKLYEEAKKAHDQKNYKEWQIVMNKIDAYLKAKNIEKKNLEKLSSFSVMKIYNDYFLDKKKIDERKDKNKRIKQYIKEIKKHRGEIVKQSMLTNLILVEMIDVHQKQYELQLKFFNAVNLKLANEGSTQKKENIKKIRQNFKSAKDLNVKVDKKGKEKKEKVPRFLQLSREAVEKDRKRNFKTAKDWDREYWK